MKILFATAGLALPQMKGGSQRTSDSIIRGLRIKGHDVRLASGLGGGDLLSLYSRVRMKIRRRNFSVDTVLGYPVYRSWELTGALNGIASYWRPDVAVVLANKPIKIAKELQNQGIPIVMALQDNDFSLLGGDFSELSSAEFVANSLFTSNSFNKKFGIISEVIYPIINESDYYTPKTGDFVTFINPDARKGFEIFLEIARARPTVKFLLLESWPLADNQLAKVAAAISELPNVTFARASSNMRQFYAKTRLLLVPSLWEEGYGRVATEAQFSGIPVIGSDRGGLPEAIGPGGRIVPADAEVPLWLEALDGLINNPVAYREASEAATRHANRPEITLDQQISRWESVIDNVHRRNIAHSTH